MATYFLDSSALVKRYVVETGTQRLLELVAQPNRLVVSRVAYAEVTAAVSRRHRGGGISAEETEEVLAALSQHFHDRYVAIDLANPVIVRAASLLQLYALRTLDAIQLACALTARDIDQTQELSFVCADRTLNAAATAEGFTVINPAV